MLLVGFFKIMFLFFVRFFVYLLIFMFQLDSWVKPTLLVCIRNVKNAFDFLNYLATLFLQMCANFLRACVTMYVQTYVHIF